MSSRKKSKKKTEPSAEIVLVDTDDDSVPEGMPDRISAKRPAPKDDDEESSSASSPPAKRRSPRGSRRSSVSTLDGATSSPGTETIGASDEEEDNREAMTDDDEYNNDDEEDDEEFGKDDDEDSVPEHNKRKFQKKDKARTKPQARKQAAKHRPSADSLSELGLQKILPSGKRKEAETKKSSQGKKPMPSSPSPAKPKSTHNKTAAAVKKSSPPEPETPLQTNSGKQKTSSRGSTKPRTDSLSKENSANASLPKDTPKEKPEKPSSREKSPSKASKEAVVSSDVKAKPKKKKKLSFQDSVLQHMFVTMKPFTLKSLAHDLKTTEAALNHVMLALIDKGLVDKNEFTSGKGRTKVLYWAVDGVKCKEVAVTHAASSAERRTVQQKLQSLRAELMTLQKTMTDVECDLSNEEIVEKLKSEKNEHDDLERQVNEIRARMQAPPTQPKLGMARKLPAKAPLNPNQLKQRINKMRDEWKSRKEKCMEFCYQMSDAMEKKPKEILNLLEVETDEQCGVTLPAKYPMETADKKKR